MRINLISPRHVLYATVLVAWMAWEVLAHSGAYPRDIFPSTFIVLSTMGLFLMSPNFYHHAATTLLEVAIAFPIGTAIGIATGICMGVCRPLGRVAEPYVSGLMAAPRIIWFPVVLMIFGTGIGSKIALGALGAIFPAVLNTYSGILEMPYIYRKVARVFRISPIAMVTKIYIPSLLRPILVGLRIGLGVCITPVLLAEIKGSSVGLGYLIITYYSHFQMTEMFAVLTFVVMIIVVLNLFLGWLIDHVSKGAPQYDRAGLMLNI